LTVVSALPVCGSASLSYIHTAFENASALYWEKDADGAAQVFLNYDVERGGVNRQTTHWHFQVHGKAGSDIVLILNNFDNIWNGRKSSALKPNTPCCISTDGRDWRVLAGQRTAANQLKLRLPMTGDTLFVARIEPYRLSDLETWIDSIRGHVDVNVTHIGRTVEGRALEVIRVGRDAAPHRILIRARAHPWESGGNWVIQGLVNSLLQEDPDNRACLDSYCLYLLPMANKDGVARGRTRFNMQGMDLNRNWDRPADPDLAPENAALETWLETMIRRKRKPDLAIDFHNDSGGRLHISRPEIDLDPYLERMRRLESLLREHTWFTEGSTGSGTRNPGTFGEGLLARYGIDALVYELNANWCAGLAKAPLGRDWERLGEQLREVFRAYFTGT
jgi:hypothetical protein